MTQFSDKCKKMLLENGSNVYQLSHNASLERTTLQRMVTGKRLPNIDFVKSFCRALRISQFEENELIKLYKIESMGESAYHNEEAIIRLLQRLKALEKNNYQECISSVNYENIELSSNVAQQDYDTRLMLHFVLAKEFMLESENTAYTNIPVTYNAFIPTLEILYQHFHKRISLMHLVYFQMNRDAASENLNMLTHVLPFFLADILDYQVFYHYSRITKNEQIHQIFPYYVITSQHVLLLSDDLATSILLSDPDTVKQYHQEFKRIIRLSKPLFYRAQAINDAFNFIKNDPVPSPSEFNALHFQPCCVKLLNKKNFIDKSKKFLPPEFSALAELFWEKSKAEISNQYHTIFSKEGLDDFCKTGRYYGQVCAFFPPLTVPERIEALNHYLADESSSVDLMLKNSPLSVPQNLFFESHGTQFLQVIRIEDISTIDFMKIEESSICEAFHQFLMSLQDSEFVYSQKETEQIITQKIRELEVFLKTSAAPPRKKIISNF